MRCLEISFESNYADDFFKHSFSAVFCIELFRNGEYVLHVNSSYIMARFVLSMFIIACAVLIYLLSMV